MEGDIPGGFGYRTAHALNAMQEFREGEAGKAKDLNDSNYWSNDPGITSSEIVRGTDARIMPVIRQRLRQKDGSYNPSNAMIQYWVAYPRMRNVSGDLQEKGIYPINTLLTRDLVLGPTPDWSDPDTQAWAKKVAVDGRTYQKQREDIEAALQKISNLPGPSSPSYDEGQVAKASGDLLDQVLAHDVIIDRGSAVWDGTGRFFNEGIGLLQLGLQVNWVKRRMDLGQDTGFVPNTNPRVFIVNEPVPPTSEEALSNSSSFLSIYEKISKFILSHPKVRRLAIYINGVQNLGLEIDESADRLQKSLLASLYPDPKEREAHRDEVLVIGVYNRSSKLFYGGYSGKLNVFDLLECLAMKSETAQPGTSSTHPDAIRLMLTLKAVSKALHLDWTFRDALLSANASLGTSAASARLAELRETLTLHAHSQGAIAAAVAQSRLGTISSYDPVLGSTHSETRTIPGLFHLVSYGGGANMHDFLEIPYFASHTHHVNERDAIAVGVGMADPLQRTMMQVLNGQVSVKNPIRSALILRYPHTRRIVKGPSPELIETLKTGHEVIRFTSYCKSLNFAEHNFLNGYLCGIGMNPKVLPWLDMGEYKARKGGDFCLLLTLLDDPNNYKDCTR